MVEQASARTTGLVSALAGLVATVLLGFLVLAAPSAEAAGKPSFKATGMQSDFDWHARDYVLRSCEGGARQVTVTGAKGWVSSVDGADRKSGSYGAPFTKTANESLTVKLKKRGKKKSATFHLRCLPDDFPAYNFDRVGNRSGGPALWGTQMGGYYGALIDSNGTPVYWVEADGIPDNFGVLPDGTLTWSPVDQVALQVGPLEVRTLKNKLLQRFEGAPGTVADIHDMILLPNGNYLFGAQEYYKDDTTAYGGSANSDVIGIQIQEYTPGGKEVWHWSSRGKIGLEETARWWDLPNLDTEPYDIVHWNAVEPVGKNFILISMRHTDAIYKIDKRTGKIVWKLGGTPTRKSLEVRGDPMGDYPFGGQHDVRAAGKNKVTLWDNQTQSDNLQPRAVKYKINEKKGTARLIDSLIDPDVGFSLCCGSARLGDDGSWLIGFGGNPDAGVAAYKPDGRLIYRFTLDQGRFTYRAKPVPPGSVSRKDLRKAMDAMAGGAG